MDIVYELHSMERLTEFIGNSYVKPVGLQVPADVQTNPTNVRIERK